MTEKQVNTIRARVQREALKSAENNPTKKSLLVLATGAGKSKIPIDFAKKKKNKVNRICLIVPTERLRDEDWKEEFRKWDAEYLWADIVRVCYASAHKLEGEVFDLTICDEVHNLTPSSALFFKNNTSKNVIGLTATEPEDWDKKLLLDRIGFLKTYELHIDDAVNLGFVAPYEITVVYTQLDEKNKNIVAGNKEKQFMQTERANYNWLNNEIIKMDHYGQTGTSRHQAYVLKRMRAIYNLKSKARAAQAIMQHVFKEGDRALVFCGSIEQSESICEYVYHSKSGKGSLNKFIAQEIDILGCVKALNEGANLPNVDKALIVQVNAKEKDLVQRIGRVIRFRKGHKAHIYILCCKDTQDEDWLAKALTSFDKSRINFTYYAGE